MLAPALLIFYIRFAKQSHLTYYLFPITSYFTSPVRMDNFTFSARKKLHPESNIADFAKTEAGKKPPLFSFFHSVHFCFFTYFSKPLEYLRSPSSKSQAASAFSVFSISAAPSS